MRRLLLALAGAALLAPSAAIYAVSASGAQQLDGRLLARVGPGTAITLSTAAGVPVTRLAPGTYEIEIDDRSPDHDFRLTGPGGVNAGTGVAFVGIRTVTVTLVAGQYTFFCSEHPYDMIGQFMVGTTQAPPPPLAGRLVATVGPGATITLVRSGRRVTSLRPGRYQITVRDRSAFHNFRLRGPGINRATAVGFVGTQTWTVQLRVGTYTFFCNPHAQRMRGTFRVAR